SAVKFGPKLAQQGQRARPKMSVPPPVPAPPRSLGARRSCPYPDTSPSPSTARHGSTPANSSRYTAGTGRGGSTPGADACPSLAMARPVLIHECHGIADVNVPARLTWHHRHAKGRLLLPKHRGQGGEHRHVPFPGLRIGVRRETPDFRPDHVKRHCTY